jgi:hypothetical protein
MAAQIVGSSGIPVAAGAVFERFGSYDPVFYSLAVMCFGCAALLLLYGSPPRRRLQLP